MNTSKHWQQAFKLNKLRNSRTAKTKVKYNICMAHINFKF